MILINFKNKNNIEAIWSLDIMNPKKGKNIVLLLTPIFVLITETIVYRKRRTL